MATMGTDIPKPIPNQDCQGLLLDPGAHGSWLRKRSFRNKLKIFAWAQVYVVALDGCVYYYRNETSTRPIGSFSLYGYNVVQRANEIAKTEAPWAFKIEHTHAEYKTYYFTASSENEMKKWMKRIKSEMKRANRTNMPARTFGDGQENENDDASLTYQDIETRIYEDPQSFKIPENYKNRTQEEVSDDDDDDLYAHRGPQPPPLPARPSPSGKSSKKKVHKRESDACKKMEKLSLTKEKEMAKGDLQRGKPDGDSLKVKVKPEVSPEPEQEEDEEDEQAKYWNSIYFYGHKDEASEIIRSLAEDGVYLVRDGEDGGKVLVVFVDNIPKKYKINCEDDLYYLTSKSSERFESVEELCFYYYSHDLPTAPKQLTTPYKLHPSYSGS